MFRKTLAAVAGLAILLFVGVSLVAYNQASRLRSRLRVAPPVPPLLQSAIVAAEDPSLFQHREASVLEALRGLSRMGSSRTTHCAPTLAFKLVRTMHPARRRPLRARLEDAVMTQVVASMFTPHELLRVYANEVYMGRVDGRNVIGMENASGVYFGKHADQLRPVEAAVLAAMIASPNAFSPRRNSERLRVRRDHVLALMAAGARP